MDLTVGNEKAVVQNLRDIYPSRGAQNGHRHPTSRGTAAPSKTLDLRTVDRPLLPSSGRVEHSLKTHLMFWPCPLQEKMGNLHIVHLLCIVRRNKKVACVILKMRKLGKKIRRKVTPQAMGIKPSAVAENRGTTLSICYSAGAEFAVQVCTP